MNDKYKEAVPCKFQPELALDCPKQGKRYDYITKEWMEDECVKCGWNPTVAKQRHEEILEKMKGKQKL